jgi:type I restriction enzyme, S subunit
LLASAYGAGKPGLNLGNLRQLPIPLPPLVEQTEIVGKVRNRLAAADRLEISLTQQLARAQATHRSLLREAFAGRLVPQDPNDEPASVLLDLIRTARERKAQSPRGKRMPKSKSKVMRRPLLEILREHKEPMTPEQLFRESGYLQEFEDNECRQDIVDRFYEELRRQVGPQGPLLEKRPDRSTVLLEIKS